MTNIPFVLSLSDYAIIISGIVIIGGTLMFAIIYGLIKLAHYVGWRYFVAWVVSIALVACAYFMLAR